MTNIGQLLKTKGNEIWSIAPQATIYEALQVMSEKDVGALLVVHKGDVVGIFSERDYARKLILKGKFSKDTSVEELMTRKVLYVGPESTIEDCMALMTAKSVRHLPILKDERLIGIVTLGDVVKQIISDQEFTIHQLENYISGSY
ncbi:MAG: CBS domain-containing protein [Desulfobacteraceae bacterium]|uniref:CBS domain-containing protein n=1 Tax=Candidatus Desulfacyla euxinica TaxID=2841693 RepID=A0A8J6T2N7_9DELT|nr:CBS domain-containing protein [Candidatus Desulfacyla euxinica]MBL6978129.1 CBS domain-containing protein [Desulfobacteraceae bacterium]MBL7216957.1 CBS domain-containing protein [Desulfobacteraceae bacterium]